MRALRYIFSFQGRFTAADIWRHQWATAAVTFPILFGVTAAFWTFTDGLTFFYGFATAIAVQSVAHLSAIVRRLHDFGLSGWLGLGYPTAIATFILLFLGFYPPVPEAFTGYAFWVGVGVFAATSLMTLALFIVPGQRRDNRFGPIPETRRPAGV